MRKENRYDSLYQYYGKEFNINWKLLKAQARAESAQNPDAVSHVGASGLAQFMPATWQKDIAPKIKRYYQKSGFTKYAHFVHKNDPEDAIVGQCIYMKQLLKMFGSVNLALCAYNWGMGNVRRISKRQGSDNYNDLKSFMPKETRDYVTRINKYYNGG